MTFVFGCVIGFVIGFDVVLLVGWLRLRRQNRNVTQRIEHPYDHLFARGELQVVPYEIAPFPERPTGGGDIPPPTSEPLASRRADQ